MPQIWCLQFGPLPSAPLANAGMHHLNDKGKDHGEGGHRRKSPQAHHKWCTLQLDIKIDDANIISGKF